ncbi:L,D-transpeptidase family protein [Fundicoccus culcitae]|uniref:L,D-transpeptidase/peptidoglycan binding protein n=1 Tax=Fundicoccus culcitae TaxID=2969821 RepID=A0ABY5P5X3_9LACT|nr:L,D-transpeptidase family protein [Fundicoccus culcitae]UUX33828.1 L,D-transpeptidase/peptidoglycan binding protein [Fundicoccus culcitae]
MNKIIKTILGSILIVVVLYFFGVSFYLDKFVANTEFGSVDISHLTLNDAQAKIEKELSQRQVQIKENGKTVASMQLADYQPAFTLETTLANHFNNQNPLFWFSHLVQANEYENVLTNNITINQADLIENLEMQGITNDQRTPSENAQITFDEDEGFYISDSTIGNQVDYELLTEELITHLDDGDMVLDIESAYLEPEYNEDDEKVVALYDKIKAASDFDYIIEVGGDDLTITQEQIENWIYFDSNNQIIFDRELITEFVNDLNESYSTFDKERQFDSTSQGTITIPPGILGWGIEIEPTVDLIIEDLKAGVDTRREPVIYSTSGVPNSANDIGTTYVEIDLTYQMMHLYYEDELILSTNIVSGQTGTETVPGANAVIEMLRDTDLVGFNPRLEKEYKVPVSYWIRFDYIDQGIHDATWQWSFGGDVYTYSGSLGCINTPLEYMGTIYEYVEYGTPVIVY